MENRPLRQAMVKGMPVIVPLLVWLIYSGLLFNGKFRASPEEYNYFKQLAVSFTQGRLDIGLTPGQLTYDLVHYKGKYYLYWPPVPALVYVPLVKMYGGMAVPDALITAFFGGVNAWLILLLLTLLSQKYGLMLTGREKLFLVVFWAFGTVHFYMSMTGRVWFISQVMAQTFLLASIVTLFSFPSGAGLFFSGLFYAAAVYTRNDLLFSVFFIAAAYITMQRDAAVKQRFIDAVLFLLPFTAFSALNMLYNAARFDGNVFENGIKYHLMNGYFAETYAKHGYLSLFYLPHNFYTEVLKPLPFTQRFPYIGFDQEGFGFLWASPVFLAIFPALYFFQKAVRLNFFRKKTTGFNGLTPGDMVLMSGALISAACVAVVVLTVMGTGWAQFAARYTLDFQVFLLIFCVFLLKITRHRNFYAAMLILLAMSVYIQCSGVKLFLKL